ncbi:GNVR domain-containing protein [Rhizobium sp. S163]|uniref:GumC family protein n=1 Tax=Rhizobium sp. S163 TaxID=3055039 RepID=UPI0025A96DA1|nr:GNVR domain-containing protein [Rhizobium sp. S163]MDM9646923.1 GNVR domain-containing protein [Rhizobium sp. S163]
MNQFDRNKVGRLPQWRSYEPPNTEPNRTGAPGPVLRPSDFVPAKPAPASLITDAAPQEPVSASRSRPVPPPAAAEPTRTTERDAPIQPSADASPPSASTVAREAAPAPLATPVTETVAAPVITPVVVQAPAPGGPLLDTRSAIQAIWNKRLLILGLSVLGAVAGAVVLPMSTQKFTANTTLYFDPRQIGLNDPSTQASGPSPEMISAMIDSQVQILSSGNVMRRVADAMKLDQDPEFNAGRADSAAVVSALQKALVITRQSSTYVVSMDVTTKNAEKSARLANQVVASFLQEEDGASSGLYQDTSKTLDNRLTDLRQKVQEAEQAVETYRADNDMASTQNGLISDQRLASLNTLLVTAQDKTIQAKARADAAANLRFEDVVGGTSQGGGVSTALATLRQQYSTQAAMVSSLESQMGTRHPRLQAARSSLNSISDQIRGELQRLASTAQGEYQQAKKAEDAVSKELSVQKALQVNTSDKQVELNELQRKATAARDIYETVLKRSGQTSEEQSLSRSNVRVISEAEPPLKANGPGKTALLIAGVIGGFFAGFLLGAGFAILASLFAHPTFRGYFRKPA